MLTTTSGTTLDGYGRARRSPGDPHVPEIGEELASARALRDVADRLLKATSDDISQLEHHEVHLPQQAHRTILSPDRAAVWRVNPR